MIKAHTIKYHLAMNVTIPLKYRYKITVIIVRKHQRILRLNTAARLYKVAARISPDFAKEYDLLVGKKAVARATYYDYDCEL